MDEPIIESHKNKTSRKEIGPTEKVPLAIRKLLKNEHYGVLATQAKGQPYASLLAFASSQDLRILVFSTPKTTRKYKFIQSCKRVAFQVDNRPKHLGEFMTIESITATGSVREISEKNRLFKKLSKLLTDKHSYLDSFVHTPSCALLMMTVTRYFHVVRFQEVSILKP